MKIGVYGSASGKISEVVRNKARIIGQQIALRGHDLITGACCGLPYDAVVAACQVHNRKGKIIGYSPAISLAEHKKFEMPTDGFDIINFIDEIYIDLPKSSRFKLRNVLSVNACDTAVFIAGGIGTTNEFTDAYDLGKNIGILLNTGGFSDLAKEIVDALGREKNLRVVYSTNPKKLIGTLENEHK